MDFFRISSLSSPGPGHLSLFSKKTTLVFSFQLSYYFVMFLAWSRPLENIWIQVKRIVVIFRKVLRDYSALQVRRSRCSRIHLENLRIPCQCVYRASSSMP